MAPQVASAQTGKMVKKDATGKPPQPFPFTTVVSFGNLLFVSGIGCRTPGTIEEQTKWVIDEIEKKIGELKAVETWLTMNTGFLQMTIKTLELQKSALESLRAAGEQAAKAPPRTPGTNK